MRWPNLLFREISERAAPISREAVDPDCGKYCVRARESTEIANPEEYPPTTVIIRGKTILGGCAGWELEIPKYVQDRLIDITLKIDTIRAHGMLHSPVWETNAGIWVNDRLLDGIKLVRCHPHGTDYGVDSRRPISVISYIDKENSKQTIKIGVEKDVLWDVDWVTLEPIIRRREIRTEAAIVIGALISAFIGAIFGLYL